jgi:hypothetical protein
LAKRPVPPRRPRVGRTRRMDGPSRRADAGPRRMDERARYMDEPSRRMDARARRVDEALRRMDEPHRRMDGNRRRVDETRGKVDALSKSLAARADAKSSASAAACGLGRKICAKCWCENPFSHPVCGNPFPHGLAGWESRRSACEIGITHERLTRSYAWVLIPRPRGPRFWNGARPLTRGYPEKGASRSGGNVRTMISITFRRVRPFFSDRSLCRA